MYLEISFKFKQSKKSERVIKLNLNLCNFPRNPIVLSAIKTKKHFIWWRQIVWKHSNHICNKFFSKHYFIIKTYKQFHTVSANYLHNNFSNVARKFLSYIFPPNLERRSTIFQCYSDQLVLRNLDRTKMKKEVITFD